MSARGILRKSPTKKEKKRNLSTHLVNANKSSQNIRLIDHNHVNDRENTFNGFEQKTKYNVSEVNTTKRVAQRLEQLKKDIQMPPAIQLSPRTKVIVTEKALKKLNYVSDAKVYKHLPPVNVNDSILGINRKIRKDKKPIVLSSIDHNPTLEKFLKPSIDLNFRLELNSSTYTDDEPIAKSLANDNFHRLYDTYRRYLDPTRHHQSNFFKSESKDLDC